MGEMSVLDRTGDARLLWSAGNQDEVDAAKEMYTKLKNKGYAAFGVTGGGGKGSQLDEFDPKMEKIIMVPPLRGG